MRYAPGNYWADCAARVAISYAAAGAAAAAVWTATRRAPPGAGRALSAVPVALALLAVPQYVIDLEHEAMFVVPVVGVFSLAAFKVLAFAMGRGPLQAAHLPTYAKFAAALSLPVIPRDAFKLSSKATSAGPPVPPAPASAFLKTYAIKAAAAVATVLACFLPLPILAVHWLYALTLSLALGAIWDLYCAAAVGLYGLDVAPSFDAPWLSSTFSDYWSKRWNLTVSYMLRVFIYEPVLEGRLVKRDNDSATACDRKQQPPPAAAAAGGGGMRVASSGAASPASSASDDTTLDADGGAGKRVAEAPAGDAAAAGGRGGGALRRREGKGRAAGGGIADLAAAGAPAGDEGSAEGAGAASGMGEAAAAAGSKGGDARRSGGGRLARRAAALCATFAFSGLWHMYIWAHFQVPGWGFRWLAFFSIQGPIVLAEAALIALWRRRWGLPPLPRWVAIPLTNFLLIVIAEPLFFGPCDETGMCSAMMGSIRQAAGAQPPRAKAA